MRQRLHVRVGPDVTQKSLGIWPIGRVLDVWAHVGDWLLVQDPDSGLTGWSNADQELIDVESLVA